MRMSQTAEVAIAISAYAIHHYMEAAAAAAVAAAATSTSTAIETPFGNECDRGAACASEREKHTKKSKK